MIGMPRMTVMTVIAGQREDARWRQTQQRPARSPSSVESTSAASVELDRDDAALEQDGKEIARVGEKSLHGEDRPSRAPQAGFPSYFRLHSRQNLVHRVRWR